MKKIAPKGSSEAFLRQHIDARTDACINWPFRLNPLGYGLATVDGKQKGAHRWMCILAHGDPMPGQRDAAHTCGNPSCVNPRHLRWATHAENMRDMIAHGTSPRGERSGKTKLTEADVKAIRSAPADLKPLMEKYGLSKHGVSKIRGGKRWAHVE